MQATDISNISSQQLPPGPSNTLPEIISHSLHFQRDMIGFLDQMATYGDMVYVRVGPVHGYLMFHPDYVHEVLVAQADKFHKMGIQKKVIGKVIGNGTFNSDGEYWKQQRKLVQPAFHAKRIAAYADVIVSETEQAINSWQPGIEYDMSREMLKITMGVISKTMFGTDIAGRQEVISHALDVCLAEETRQMTALYNLPDWLPTPNQIRFRRAIKLFDDLMYEFINTRRQSDEDRGDLLSMLLLAADEEHRMNDQEVRDEALTLFSAGHETSANTLTWTLAELANHPEVVTKLREEVDRVLGSRSPTLHDLRNLPYTERVIKESMRLHPTAHAFGREPIEDVTIGGYTILKGSVVMLSPHISHRDPRYFERPTEFIPERFVEGFEKTIPRYAYFPFGGGPHVCTGQALAMMELQVVLAMLVQRCDFTRTPGQSAKPKIVLLQRHGDGLRMKVKPRQVAAV